MLVCVFGLLVFVWNSHLRSRRWFQLSINGIMDALLVALYIDGLNDYLTI